MRYRSLLPLLLMLLTTVARADDSDKPWEIHGQVVDEQGKPVEEFEAATFWLSNGNWWDERGELLPEAKAGKLWTNEGVLVASPKQAVKRLPEGRFTFSVDGYERVTLCALIDKRHERGGIVSVDQKSADKPITITLAPLTRVTAKVYSAEAGRTPDWTTAAVWVLGDKGKDWRLMHAARSKDRFPSCCRPATTSCMLVVNHRMPNYLYRKDTKAFASRFRPVRRHSTWAC